MIREPENRLGRNSSDEVKNHPFFSGVDWNTIRNIEPPFVPHLKCAILFYLLCTAPRGAETG